MNRQDAPVRQEEEEEEDIESEGMRSLPEK